MRDPENRSCKCTICAHVTDLHLSLCPSPSGSSCLSLYPSFPARDISKTIPAHQHHRCQPLFPLYIHTFYTFFCLPDIRTRHKSMFDFPNNNWREIRKEREREGRRARTQDIMFAPCLKFFFPGLLFCFLFFAFRSPDFQFSFFPIFFFCPQRVLHFISSHALHTFHCCCIAQFHFQCGSSGGNALHFLFFGDMRGATEKNAREIGTGERKAENGGQVFLYCQPKEYLW